MQRFLVTPERALGNSHPGTDAATHILPKSTQLLAPLRVARREASDAFGRTSLIVALERAHGNVTRAAAIAEVSRQIVQKLMRKHDIG